MECKKVPVWNVDWDEIQDVLGDKALQFYGSRRNINLKDIFVSGDIVDEFIDPEWCAGDTPAERKQELSDDDPVSCYDYIQYGGCIDDDGVPEIYFSNLFGWNPEDAELLEGKNKDYTNKFPTVPIYTAGNILAKYYIDHDAEYPLDKGFYNSSYYRDTPEEFLQTYGISSKVKVDYNGTLPDNVDFRLKVTMVLGTDYLDQDKYYYTKAANVTDSDITNFIPGAIIAAPVSIDIITEGAGEELFYYLWGKLEPKLVKLAKGIVESAAVEGLGALSGAALLMYLALRAAVNQAEFYFDVGRTLLQPNIKNGDKFWNIISGGNYNNYDVRESSILFNHNVFKNTTNQTEWFAKNGAKETDIINYNSLDLNKWFNFEVRPRGTNFDPITLPPTTMYIVEIIPVNNCKVSTNPTKPHVISFFAHPDKYIKPEYDVIPSGRICSFATTRLKNAIYADHIYLLDRELSGSFDKYHNIVINTGNYKNNETTIHLPYIGTDIIEPANKLTANYGGKYEVLFMKDINPREQQLVFNHSFIDRGYGNDAYDIIKKYWEIPSNWINAGGAIYRKDSSDTMVTQYLPGFVGMINWHALFRFDIEIVNGTSGKAYVDVTGLFEAKLCKDKYQWTGILNNNPHVIDLPLGEYPDGVTRIGNRFYFDGVGTFTLFFKGIANNATDRTLKIGGDSVFNRGISTVKLKRISPLDPLDKDRAVPMFNKVIDLGSCGDNARAIHLLVARSIANNTFTFSIGQFYVGQGLTVPVTVDWGDGTITNHDVWLATDISHTYGEIPMFTNVLIKIKIGAYAITQSNAAIVPYFKCNEPALIDFADYSSLLVNSSLNFSYSGLRSASIIDTYTDITSAYRRIDGTALDGASSGGGLIGNEWYIPMLSKFVRLKELRINNTKIANDLYYIGGVSDYIDISNTPIAGDLSELSSVGGTIIANNTKVDRYSGVPKMYCRNIYWQDSDPLMNVNALNNLCRDLYNSSLRGGTLYIASNNPQIIDEEVLWFIFQLVHQAAWVVVYNGYYITTANEQNYLQGGKDDYIYTHNP